MKRLFATLAILLLCMTTLAGCVSPASAPATSAPPTTAPSTGSTSSPSTAPVIPTQVAATSPSQPQYGGTFKVILTALPANIGYLPTMASDGQSRSSMWAERLMDVDLKGDLVPCLAESWDIDSENNTITFHLRKGVKFHDGTDFNAEAVKWNYQQAWEAKALPDGQFLQSIDVIDEHTIKFTMNKPNSIMIYALWRPWIFSPTAFEKNGKDWCVTHPVSTSAFKVVEYQRDVMIKMEKFDGYWREGRPYLDAIELRLVKDPATCSMMMQSGQADMWIQATAQEAGDLRDKGYPVLVGISRFNVLAPDSLNPSSPFAKKEVREAVEYALDRQGITKALGFGFSNPMDQLATAETAGHNPDFPVRSYNIEKAKKLLADAGYPNGFETTLTLLPTMSNMGAIIQNSLGAAGIKVKLEVSDSGKYYAKQQAEGWQGLLLTVTAISPEYSVAFVHHFSQTPDIKFISLAKSPEFYSMVDKTLLAKDIPSMREATKQMVTQGSLDAMVIPINTEPVLSIVQPYVNTTYTRDLYWTGWRIGDDWLAKK